MGKKKGMLAGLLGGLIAVVCLCLAVVVWQAGILDLDPEEGPARSAAATATPTPTRYPWASTPAGQATATPGSAAALPPAAVPTEAPPPTASPTPPPPSEPQGVVDNDTLNVRAGPGTNYPRVATLARGDTVTVTGKNKAGTWLAVTLSDGRPGWVYADYVKVNVPLDAVAVAKAPPAPAPAEPEATRSPTPTMSVDDEIAKVARGQHGTLPQPGESGPISAGGEVEVTVINDTPHVLTLLIGSPSSIKVQIEACGSCKVYSGAGPSTCAEEGRPRKTIRLKAGNSQVVAKVNDPGVTPFYGTWELRADTSYFNCFFIVRR